MIEITDKKFQSLIDEALGKLPPDHVKNIKNVAILYEDEPTFAQCKQLLLHKDQTLLGLYEGIPLSQRQGMTRVLPDKITLFKGPLTRRARSIVELEESIRHTIWHEVAHYYGLNHKQINELE